MPLKLRGSRIPVRRRVTRKAASHQDAVPDPFVLRREVYHAVVKAAVAIEPNLDDVRGGQTQVRAGPDVREPLRRRRRTRVLHQIWVGVLFVIVRRDQDPVVSIFKQAEPVSAGRVLEVGAGRSSTPPDPISCRTIAWSRADRGSGTSTPWSSRPARRFGCFCQSRSPRPSNSPRRGWNPRETPPISPRCQPRGTRRWSPPGSQL